MKAGIAGLAALLLIPLLLAIALVAALAPMLGTTTGTCTLASTPSAQVVSYQPDQITNAATIVAVGRQLQVPQQGWVVAIAAALQESGLRNLDYGDRDSLGLFQQRPSQGWGTPAQILDPTYSATAFYQHLLTLPRWQQLSVNDAAQAVQRSATPGAYAKHEPAARALAGAVHDATCSQPRPPGASSVIDARACSNLQINDPRALIAVTYACAQLGKPYVWGGNGDPGFDCSGLTTAAYNAAGIHIPRTAHTQYEAGPLLPPGTPLAPGDLIFFGTITHVSHVAISLGGTAILHAPTAGETVQISDYRSLTNALAASRPSVDTT